MIENGARFEFRAWGRRFGKAAARLRDLAPCFGVRESDEFYIVVPGREDYSVKIRYGTLDIKALLGRQGGLEHWCPCFRMAFPIPAEMLAPETLEAKTRAPETPASEAPGDEAPGTGTPGAETARAGVLPLLGLSLPEPAGVTYSPERFLEEVVRPREDVILAEVFKRRLFFQLGGCRAELVEVRIDGAALRTMAVEGPDAAAVLRLKARLGLEAHENLCYPRAIERALGRVPGEREESGEPWPAPDSEL